jgi:large subunit ribosomal protein L28
MSRVCQVTKKDPMYGNVISHSNRKSRRRFLPNLHWHRFWLAAEKKFVRLLVSNKGLRTIDKQGIEKIVGDLRANGEDI